MGCESRVLFIIEIDKTDNYVDKVKVSLYLQNFLHSPFFLVRQSVGEGPTDFGEHLRFTEDVIVHSRFPLCSHSDPRFDGNLFETKETQKAARTSR